MRRHNYEIGKKKDEMVNVEDLVPGEICPPPGGSIVKPYAVYRTAASGLEYGDGFPSCEWFFPRMSVAHMNAMLSYLGKNQSAVVYIRTRTESGEYKLFKGVMHRPKLNEEMTFGLRTWRDVTFRFTMLEEQEET